MNKKPHQALLLLAVLMMFAGSSHAGGTYKFTVSCRGGAKIVQWRTGDIDPGKEYLRIATGTDNPSCAISDFSAVRDSDLPVEVKQGSSAVWSGSKPIQKLLGFFGIKI